MNRKKYKQLIFVSVICLIIIILEISYVVYNSFNSNNTQFDFSVINSFHIYSDNYVVVGSNNDNNNSYEKAFFAKYDMKKNKVLEKIYNIGYNSSFYDSISDGDDILVVGSYEKTNSDYKSSIRKGLLVKYDKNGNIIFSKDFSLLDNTRFNKIIKINDCFYVIGQSIYKSNKLGNLEGGAIFAKYDKDGELLWYKTFGDNKGAIFNDLVFVDNYFYIVGYDGRQHAVILKYDDTGNLVNSLESSEITNKGYTGIVYSNSYIYVCGQFVSKGVVVKYNDSLEEITSSLSDYNGSTFNRMVVDDNNLIVIGNIVPSREGEYKTNVGLISKLNDKLTITDSVVYDNNNGDYFTDIVNYKGKYIVSGYSFYSDDSFVSKIITYSSALKLLEVF